MEVMGECVCLTHVLTYQQCYQPIDIIEEDVSNKHWIVRTELSLHLHHRRGGRSRADTPELTVV